MRPFVLVTNAALVALWLIGMAVTYFKGAAFDTVAVLGLNIVIFGVPAFALGYFKRWLPFAVALTSISLFLLFSVVVGSQISS
jgi:hypothetical protein